MKLILGNWDQALRAQLEGATSLKMITPSFSMMTVEILQEYDMLPKTELITRYSLYDFFVKLSDIQALQLMLEQGASVFGLKSLHCKLYIFSNKSAIITSSNFTWGGMFRNHECGILLEDPAIIGQLLSYFEKLKAAAKSKLALATCKGWEQELSNYTADYLTPKMMPDYGETSDLAAAFVQDI